MSQPSYLDQPPSLLCQPPSMGQPPWVRIHLPISQPPSICQTPWVNLLLPQASLLLPWVSLLLPWVSLLPLVTLLLPLLAILFLPWVSLPSSLCQHPSFIGPPSFSLVQPFSPDQPSPLGYPLILCFIPPSTQDQPNFSLVLDQTFSYPGSASLLPKISLLPYWFNLLHLWVSIPYSLDQPLFSLRSASLLP
jgi:hypothetical protein